MRSNVLLLGASVLGVLAFSVMVGFGDADVAMSITDVPTERPAAAAAAPFPAAAPVESVVAPAPRAPAAPATEKGLAASPARAGIRIRTVDAMGGPLAGVAVGLSEVSRPLGIRRTRRLGISGPRGILVVPVTAPGRLVADRIGLRSRGVEFDPATTQDGEIELVVAPTAPLRVRVRGADGRPLNGARLTLRAADNGGDRPVVATADAAGEARFLAVALGAALDLSIRKAGLASTRRVAGPRYLAGDVIELEVAEAVTTIRGRAFAAHGAIAGRELQCRLRGIAPSARGLRVRTDAHGRFELQLPAAEAAALRGMEVELLNAGALSGCVARVDLTAWQADPATPLALILRPTAP